MKSRNLTVRAEKKENKGMKRMIHKPDTKLVELKCQK